VAYAFHLDPVGRRGPERTYAVLPALRKPLGRVLVRDGIPELEALEQLVDDDLGGDLGLAEGDVEVVGLPEAHLADHVGEQRRAGDLLRRKVLVAQGVVECLAAAALGVLPALAREPGADLVARARGLDQRQPVARG